MALLTTAAERRAVKNRKGFDGYKFTGYTGLLIFYINWNEGDQERQTKIYSDTGAKIRLIDIGADATERFCKDLKAGKITIVPGMQNRCEYLLQCLKEEEGNND